jgi:hypothetical protein
LVTQFYVLGLGRIIELNRNPVTNQRIQRPMSMNDLHRTITLDQQDNNLGTRQLIIGIEFLICVLSA